MKLFYTIELIKKDFRRNKKNYKLLFVLFSFRVASHFYLSKKNNVVLYLLGIPILIFYRVVVEWILGIEIPAGCKIGGGLIIDHGQALVLNRNVVIGRLLQ